MTIESFIRNTVIDMWKVGKTALQISSFLKAKGYHLSRSAISGRVKRLQDAKILRRRSVAPATISERKAKVPAEKKAPSPPVVEIKHNNPVSLLDLKLEHCRYPLSNAMFCGDPIHKISYCLHHYKLCYNTLLNYRGIANVTINPTFAIDHAKRKRFGSFRY
jgi:hypothetical protein